MATQKIASRRRRLLSAPAYPAMRDEQIRVPKEARRARRVCKFACYTWECKLGFLLETKRASWVVTWQISL